MPAASSSVVHPVRAMISGSATSSFLARSALASCTGQRPAESTPSPIVYESPSARYRMPPSPELWLRAAVPPSTRAEASVRATKCFMAGSLRHDDAGRVGDPEERRVVLGDDGAQRVDE